MFSKADKTPAGRGPGGRAPSSGGSGGAERSGGVPSIISPDLKIVGDLKSNGDLQIDGTVEGDINSRSVTIGEGAVVHGALVADTVRIYGAVTGQVRATSVMLAKTARVKADITHQTLSMDVGAAFEGQVNRLDRAVGDGEERTTAVKPEQASATASPAASPAGSPDTSTQGAYGARRHRSSEPQGRAPD